MGVTSRSHRQARFRFGANWRRFARLVDEDRIREACESLSSSLGDISGLRFLDVGCGSGLFSMAAIRLGAASVRSFDLDVESVSTAQALRERFEPAANHWTIEQGDILDRRYIDSLGGWDIVYCWGAVHHTGDMRRAWGNVAGLVAPQGRLFISVYNDQGALSAWWRTIKRSYQAVPAPLRPIYVMVAMAPRETGSLISNGPAAYLEKWRDYKHSRGMSRWHDLVDWVGGYPFEVAKPHEVVDFFSAGGFSLEASHTKGHGSGCNEFLLRRTARSAVPVAA